MNILISGAGAIGQLYGALFAAAGHQVSFYGANGPIAAAEYQLQQRDGTLLSWHSSDVQQPQIVIICTKAYQAESAVITLLAQQQLSPQTPVILLHNGLGPHEAIAARLAAKTPLILASSRQGALRMASKQVKHTGLGATDLGLLQGSSAMNESILALFQQSIGDCHWHQQVLQPLWHKLLINSVINPLTARDRVTNGELCGHQYQTELKQLCAEACQIAQACHIDIQPETLFQQVLNVAAATASNRSSMLQDVTAGRMTEIDYINGYLIKQAQRLGLACPAHQALVAQLTDS
ncbi:2-dehydropantoate 2-reductase [Neiella sp. HB171785]|uniref:2-dehydropantoate 2-reductase n=1 Tax=Neiella litorisoli TaxID=2771431 RepID=A0A8J6QUC6_9GAMM|nr:2-dehydropantoate 2-reductase [Neiella litorisoli]MBD1388813.1 2-dehydropantoate 2-reductase [Neiella litorisoli]